MRSLPGSASANDRRQSWCSREHGSPGVRLASSDGHAGHPAGPGCLSTSSRDARALLAPALNEDCRDAERRAEHQHTRRAQSRDQGRFLCVGRTGSAQRHKESCHRSNDLAHGTIPLGKDCASRILRSPRRGKLPEQRGTYRRRVSSQRQSGKSAGSRTRVTGGAFATSRGRNLLLKRYTGPERLPRS